jgi:hypothetical protein
MSDMENEIINKVANSGLVTIDLEEYYPEGDRIAFDIAPLLWQGLVLKEKDFREFIATHDWQYYQGAWVTLYCSADALVPTWAYMLLVTRLQPFAKGVYMGTLEQLEVHLYNKMLERLPLDQFIGAKVVVKGCSKKQVPISAYVELTRLLMPLVSSLMYGEPCSTVPLFKKKGK